MQRIDDHTVELTIDERAISDLYDDLLDEGKSCTHAVFELRQLFPGQQPMFWQYLSDMDPRHALGRVIDYWRQMYGISRGELAKASDVSYPYISEVINGTKEPSLSVLRRIATVLCKTPGHLLSDAEQFAVGDMTLPPQVQRQPRRRRISR